jgi:polysaccharide pyruvyl transferase WcaK-like protein
MSHKRKKAAILGLIGNTNIGDPIITETTKYLYSLVYPDWDYEIIDLRGYNTDGKIIIVLPLSLFDKYYIFLGRFIRRLLYYCNKKIWKKYDYHFWKTRKTGEQNIYTFFKNKLSGINLIIIAGGGIIGVVHDNWYLYIDIITKIAEEYEIPIIYNAVGFDGPIDINDFRGKILYDSLNSKCVKNISVREYPDKMRYFLSEKIVQHVCDPAVWSYEAFNLKKNDQVSLIGINIIRPQIFLKYGHDIMEKDLLELFIDIIDKLEKRYICQLFTNGVMDDYIFGKKILKKMKKKEEYLIKRPLNSITFLSQLSNYSGCICTRMHASICAYSLKIPTVSLSWNKKINSFYEAIGYPERCFDASEFSADKIVSGMIMAIEEQYDMDNYNAFRETIKSSIKNVAGYFT